MVSTARLASATALLSVACASASYIPPETPPACAPATQAVRAHELTFGVRLYDGPGPFASGGRVVTARNLGTTRSERMETYALDPVTGAEESLLREGTYETELLDAAGGATLFVRTPSGAGSGRPSLVYADATGERTLDTIPEFGGDIPVRYQRSRRGARLVMPGRAAAIIGGELVYFDGATATRIDRTEIKRRAHLFEEGLVYTSVTGLYVWTNGQRTRIATDVDAYNGPLSASRGHVYYATREGLWRYGVATGERRQLAQETCWSLSSDGPRVLAACGDTGTPWLAQSLRIYEGDSVRAVPTLGGLVGEARLSGGRAVWFEYADLQPQRPAGTARLVAWPGHGAPRELARIGSPCHNCGHTASPEPNLSFEGELIAWSYARIHDEASSAAAFQAYAAWPRECP